MPLSAKKDLPKQVVPVQPPPTDKGPTALPKGEPAAPQGQGQQPPGSPREKGTAPPEQKSLSRRFRRVRHPLPRRCLRTRRKELALPLTVRRIFPSRSFPDSRRRRTRPQPPCQRVSRPHRSKGSQAPGSPPPAIIATPPARPDRAAQLRRRRALRS